MHAGEDAIVSNGDSSTFEFANYGEVLRRRWLLVVVGLLVGIVLATLALQYVPKTYTSTASVIVLSTNGDTTVENSRTSSAINLDTEAQIVTSNVVASLAGQSLDATANPRDLVEKVSVTVPPNTSVLDISFSASSAREAQKGAHAFANFYLQNRKQLAEDQVGTQVHTLQDKIQELGKQLRSAGRRIAALGPLSSKRSYEVSQRALLVRQIASLNSQLTPLTSGEINPGSIITDAQLPTAPSNPNPKLLVASGLLAGLLAGLLLAVAVDRLDKRVRDRKDLERLGLDSLVGRISVPSVIDGASIVGAAEGAESLRQLRNALLAQMPVSGGSILVASASPGPTGSAVAVSLAVIIARSGSSVILVSANSEDCAVKKAFCIPEHPGLADLVAGRTGMSEAVRQAPDIHNLKVLTAGAEGPRYSDLLQSASVQRIFSELHDQAEFIIIDVAPITYNADAQTLAATSRGVLLVTTALQTTRAEVVEAVDQLNHVSATMAGSIIVSVNRERKIATPRTKERSNSTIPPPSDTPVDQATDPGDTHAEVDRAELQESVVEVATSAKHRDRPSPLT